MTLMNQTTLDKYLLGSNCNPVKLEKQLTALNLPDKTTPCRIYTYDKAKSRLTKSELKNLAGIYGWLNTRNGTVYTGSAKYLNIRPFEHLNKSSNLPLKNAFAKYGYDSFVLVIYEIIGPSELATKDVLETREDIYLVCIPLNLQYNLARKAYSLVGVFPSPATKARISASMTGAKHPLHGKSMYPATLASISSPITLTHVSGQPINTYPSQKAAADALGCHRSTIGRAIKSNSILLKIWRIS